MDRPRNTVDNPLDIPYNCSRTKDVHMYYWMLFFLLLIHSTNACAQRASITTDIFGNLDFTSVDGRYTATLEKNILSDLIFSDSKQNEVVFEKKYVEKQYAGIVRNKKKQTALFQNLIRQYAKQSGYRAKYRIDIFDNIRIEDNRGYQWEEGTDIFGNETLEEVNGGIKTSLKRTIQGGLEFSQGTERGTLKKDIFDVWHYEDTYGNHVQFGKPAWKRLLNRFGDDKEVFIHLLNQYFF